MEAKAKWRWGKNRWIVLLFIILGAVGASYFPPIRPHIQVAPETLTGVLFTLPVIGAFKLTNTLVASIIVMILLILLAFFVNRALKKGDLVLKGIPGVVELAIEGLYNLTENTAGKWAKTIFPYFATIVLIVLLSNWMELIPGVDSIGSLEPVGHSVAAEGKKIEGYGRLDLAPGVAAIVNTHEEGGEKYAVVPWIRVASTDLNFTLALALISVIMTQIIGLRAQGLRYFTKFFNYTNLFKKPFFGAMDFLISILELISELAKILSFSFRLFGNIFAGSVLIFLVGSMIPIFAQSFVLMFEFFIGLIQALVFGMLTMVFMTMATQGHGGEHEENHA